METFTFNPSMLCSIFKEGGIVICAKDKHSSKMSLPIELTEEGASNDTFVNEEHPQNAKSPIEITEEGIVTCFKEEQSWKALFSILFKDEGIDICCKDEHPMKE